MADGLIDLKFIAMSMVDNILGEYGLAITTIDDVQVIDEDKFKQIVFDELQTKKEEYHHKSSPKSEFKYWDDVQKPFSIKSVNRDGTVVPTQGRPYGWAVDDILFIRKNMENIVTYGDFLEMCNKITVSNKSVQRIMWNWENTDCLDKVVEEYQNLQYTHKQLPLQNNPQKRKEMGYYQ